MNYEFKHSAFIIHHYSNRPPTPFMIESRDTFTCLDRAINSFVVGQSKLVQQLLVALLAGGHVILEGVPGTGKTLLVKVLAQLIGA